MIKRNTFLLVSILIVGCSLNLNAKDKSADKPWSKYFLAMGKIATASALAPGLVLGGAKLGSDIIGANSSDDAGRTAALGVFYTASIIATFDLYKNATKSLNKSISKKRPLSKACSLVASTLLGGLFGIYCAAQL